MGEVRVKAKANALLDTGAVRTVLPAHVADQLGLGLRGQLVAEYPDGRKETVNVTEPVVVELEGRDTLEDALVLGDEVSIGHQGQVDPEPSSQPTRPLAASSITG